MFEVRFESAYNNATEWIEGKLLDQLNALRE